jgi:chromosome partitioning protein
VPEVICEGVPGTWPPRRPCASIPPMVLSIAFCCLKGGVGKSTLAIHVASALHGDGHRVLLVDADEQRTSCTWANQAASLGHEAPPVVSITGAALAKTMASVGEGFDVVIIDSPPRLGVEARAVMAVASLVVVPVTPGAADVWAASQTVALIEEARAFRPSLEAVAVLNRADRTSLTKGARQGIEALGVTLLDAHVGARVAFGEATLSGQGVCSYAPSSEAAREVRKLTKALLGAVSAKGVVAA